MMVLPSTEMLLLLLLPEVLLLLLPLAVAAQTEKTACDEQLGHLRPTLFLIGGQKCGTSSLFTDLVRHGGGGEGGGVHTACRWRHDPKECNVFTTHTTLAARSELFGKLFCRPGSSTRNYCARLRGRPPQPASYFLSAYDGCASAANSGSATTCRHVLVPPSDSKNRTTSATTTVTTTLATSNLPPGDNHNTCAPQLSMDASPTYLSRPHCAGTLRAVLGWSHAPLARLVASLRDPCARTISYFNHAVTNNWANLRRRFQREPGFSFGRWAGEEVEKVQGCLRGEGFAAEAAEAGGAAGPGWPSKSSARNASLPSSLSSVSSPPLRAWPDCGILGLNAGIYASQLESWLSHFPPRQFMVISFEAAFLQDDGGVGQSTDDLHARTIADVLRFAGAPSSSSSAQLSAASSMATAARHPPPPSPATLAKRSKRASFSHKNYDEATTADLQLLSAYFAAHNRRLVDLLEQEPALSIAPSGMTPRDLVGKWR